MPTFFEVYQYYLKDSRAIQLSPKKYKELNHAVKNYYDRSSYKIPLEYKEVEENGKTINVRIYPPAFGNRMLQIIISFCETYKTNCANYLIHKNKKDERLKKQPDKPVEKKKRQRKPAQKPAFSLKK